MKDAAGYVKSPETKASEFLASLTQALMCHRLSLKMILSDRKSPIYTALFKNIEINTIVYLQLKL